VVLYLCWRLDITNYANSHKNIDKTCSNNHKIHHVHVVLVVKNRSQVGIL
jgi:hypothetical protein